MIYLNVHNLCVFRGIAHPYAALTKAGISHKLAIEYLKGTKPTIQMQHIEILCKLFNCTPNELFVWRPNIKEDDRPDHPLQHIRIEPLPNMKYYMSTVTVKDARNMVQKILNGEGKED